MASRRNTKLRDTDKETSVTPDRPDRIASREGDPGEVIETIDGIGGKKGNKGEVDINAPLRTDDARSDQGEGRRGAGAHRSRPHERR
jgi:hypothetical protein